MCGIAGFAGGNVPDDAEEVSRAMARALAHRGPDGGAAVGLDDAEGRPVGWLSHRRLKILDLTDAADQPMSSGGRVLVFNGEIYNFRELRHELAGRGHGFRSTGDTEVVLRAYEEWQGDFVRRLHGMFALALWDRDRGELHLARDRVGKKPLFYAIADGRLTFGSEIKALAETPWVRLEADLAQLPALLTFGYVPGPATAYRAIHQLPPATQAVFDARTGRMRATQYWDPAAEPPAPADAELPGWIAASVEEATARRMVADVPLGCLLSGGIDSSIVAALMCRLAPGEVRTFSAGLADEPSFDETSWARLVAERLGTRHRDFAVRADAVALLDRLIALHDGPFADSSAVPTYLVCRAAREEVTVVLTGDGGDEVFGGYDRFAAARLAEHVPAAVAAAGAALVRALPHGASYGGLRARIERFGAGRGTVLDRYLDWIRVFDRDALAALLAAPPADDPAVAFQAAAAESRGGTLDGIIHANLRTYLPDDLCVKLDRMSMAHSLEARSPFLDHRLIDRLARVRARDKVGLRQVKPLLRRAFGPLLPAEVWSRPKHGFGAPVDRWFRGELDPLVTDELLVPGARLAPLVAQGEVRHMWEDHRAGRARHGNRLWTLLTLERWLRALERPQPLAAAAEPVLDAG